MIALQFNAILCRRRVSLRNVKLLFRKSISVTMGMRISWRRLFLIIWMRLKWSIFLWEFYIVKGNLIWGFFLPEDFFIFRFFFHLIGDTMLFVFMDFLCLLIELFIEFLLVYLFDFSWLCFLSMNFRVDWLILNRSHRLWVIRKIDKLILFVAVSNERLENVWISWLRIFAFLWARQFMIIMHRVKILN